MAQKIKIILLVACLALLNACKDYDAKDCSLAICSEQFISIFMNVVSLTDGGMQQPLALDAFQIIEKSDESIVALNFSADDFLAMQENGRYLVYNDNFVHGRENTQVVLEFIGIVGSEEVVRGEVTVNIDCCHVSTTSSLKLILE